MPDREKVIKGLECCGTNRSCIGCPYVDKLFDGCYGSCISYLNRDALELLKEQPDIVRCKDCKHYGYHNMTNVDGFCYCLKRHEYPHPDWFCADGERQ